MSTRQERELQMRTTMVVTLARVVLAAQRSADHQALLDRDDIAGDKLGELEAEMEALMRHDWARELLAAIQRPPRVPVHDPGQGRGSPR